MAAKDVNTPPRVENIVFPSGPHMLQGTVYYPLGPAQAAVLISGATGVSQRYYQAFAQWLADTQNVVVMTYDYRDYGQSASAHPRTSDATMADWGIDDVAAGLAALKADFPDLPIWLVGHSLGGLLLHYIRDLTGVERIVSVATGLSHWTGHPMPFRALAMLFWYGHVPAIVRLLGYLPGRLVGFGADLPPGVFWQWRRWCTSRGFFERDLGTGLSPQQARVSFVAIADDRMIPPPSVWRLMRYYPGTPKKQITIQPAEFGLGKIDHIGPFAARNAAIWPRIMADFTPPEPATEPDRPT